MPEIQTFKIEGVVQELGTVPEIIVDGGQGMFAKDGMVRFNLYTDRLLSPYTDEEKRQPIRRVVTARIVMTERTFRQVAEWLKKAADELTPEAPQKAQ